MRTALWPVRYQLALRVAAIQVVVMALFMGDIVLHWRAEALEAHLAQTMGLAQALATNSASWLLTGDQTRLQAAVTVLGSVEGLRTAMALSPDGRVLAHSDPGRIGSWVDDSVSSSLRTGETGIRWLAAGSGVSDCAAPVLAGGRLVGWVRVSLDRQAVDDVLARLIWHGAAFTLLGIGLGTLSVVAVAGRLTRRLEAMVATSRAVHGGGRQLRVADGDRDEVGALARAFNAMLDALERSERQLLTERERYNLAVESTREGLWDWQPGQGLVYFSARWKELVGYAPEELPDRIETWWRLVHPDDVEAVRARYLALAAGTGPACDCEFRLCHKSGQLVWVSCSALAQRDACGRVVRVVGAIADITQRKGHDEELSLARNAAERANLAKSEFLARMSHELRTPLNSILGFSEMIRDELLGPCANPHYAEYAGYINVSGQHLLSLINDILDLSKIEAGKVELERVPLDVRHLVNAVLVLVRETAARARVAVTLALPPDLPPVWADERALKQILFNLLSNALKFTPPGGIVTISAQAGEAGRIEISVADTGIGIPADQLQRVLKPFEQLDNRYSRAIPGTGLGLSLVQGLAALHGGHITLTSTEGTGTTVTLVLPPPKAAAGTA